MSGLEIAATVFGLINVYLIVRRNIWNFPFGLVMVVLYAKIFFDYKLYSDSLLQLYYIVVQLYGWWYWLRGRRPDGLIDVETLDTRGRLIAGAVIVAGAAALGWGMSNTDASVPYWDATTTVTSLVAMVLLSRRKLENWVLWIAVDVLSIGIYSYKELYLTAGLYAVFLGLASWGLVEWLRAWRVAGEPAPVEAEA